MGDTPKRFSATRRIQRYAGRLIRINTALNLNFLRHGEQEPTIDLAVASENISWFLNPGLYGTDLTESVLLKFTLAMIFSPDVTQQQVSSSSKKF